MAAMVLWLDAARAVGAPPCCRYDPACMQLQRFIPLPTPGDIGGYLPSPSLPSDHLAVVAELSFSTAASAAGGRLGGEGVGDGSMGAGGAPAGGSGSSAGVGGGGGGGSEGARAGRVHATSAPGSVGLAVAALQRGELIAVPTDTIYGLAADARSPAALEQVYRVKRRRGHKPLAICVGEVDDVGRYGDTAHLPPGLLEDLLPGPVTLLLRRRAAGEGVVEGGFADVAARPLPASLNPGADKIGVRIPDAAFVRDVARKLGAPLALTSANVSGGQSSVEVEEFEVIIACVWV
jgi:tRNA threonylcarbamoyl adenosine modification protein (Sua5/YciO/YrdC/YwlC family)